MCKNTVKIGKDFYKDGLLFMYYVVINPASKSGRGSKIWSALEPVFIKKQIPYTACFSKKAGQVIEIVRNLCTFHLITSGQDVLKLIVLGGDGTLNEALQGITDFDKVHIGYIPTGSSNDMARDLKASKDAVITLNRILSCQEPVKMDIGCVSFGQGKRYFAVSCGIGFDAAVCTEALTSPFKNIMNKIGLGKLTYLGIALKQLLAAKKVSCKITLDNQEVISLPRFLFIANMVHQFEGGGFKFCPGADAHDGLFDICAAGDISKWLILFALPTAFAGSHYRFNGIDRYRAKDLQIETSDPLWFHTDGEVFVKSDKITLTCEKDKLQLLW